MHNDITANRNASHRQLFHFLVALARKHTPERLYAEPVCKFTDSIVDCLLEGGDVDDVKYPQDEPTLLATIMEEMSSDGSREWSLRLSSPMLVRLCADLYACGDSSCETANWILVDLLGFKSWEKGYFAQMKVVHEPGSGQHSGWSEHFLVSTPAFERHFNTSAHIPIIRTPTGYEVLVVNPYEVPSYWGPNYGIADGPDPHSLRPRGRPS